MTPRDPRRSPVTMFTTQWCGYCVRLKKLMQREGIEFAEVDIENDAAAADTRHAGQRRQPHGAHAAVRRRHRADQPEPRPGEVPARSAVGGMSSRDPRSPALEGA